MIHDNVGFDERYAYWLKKLDAWCTKHKGLTREQAISVLFDDTAFNPDGPDQVRAIDLYFSETNAFHDRFVREFKPSAFGSDHCQLSRWELVLLFFGRRLQQGALIVECRPKKEKVTAQSPASRE